MNLDEFATEMDKLTEVLEAATYDLDSIGTSVDDVARRMEALVDDIMEDAHEQNETA